VLNKITINILLRNFSVKKLFKTCVKIWKKISVKKLVLKIQKIPSQIMIKFWPKIEILKTLWFSILVPITSDYFLLIINITLYGIITGYIDAQMQIVIMDIWGSGLWVTIFLHKLKFT